jgi:hypothetical protein
MDAAPVPYRGQGALWTGPFTGTPRPALSADARRRGPEAARADGKDDT